MGIFMRDAHTTEGFTDLDVIEGFCNWFQDVVPTKIFAFEGGLSPDNDGLLAALQEVPASHIWIEYTDGFSAIFHAESEGLWSNGSLLLPQDAHVLRVFIAEKLASKEDFKDGVITGGLFACESCQQIYPEPVDKSCDLCDHTGPAWMTVFDDSAREDLEECFQEMELEIPSWLPVS